MARTTKDAAPADKRPDAQAEAAATSKANEATKLEVYELIDEAARGGPDVSGKSPRQQKLAKERYENRNYMRAVVEATLADIDNNSAGLSEEQKKAMREAAIQELKDSAAKSIDKGPDRTDPIKKDLKQTMKDTIAGLKDNFDLFHPIDSVVGMVQGFFSSMIRGTGHSLMKHIVLIGGNTEIAAKIKNWKNNKFDRGEGKPPITMEETRDALRRDAGQTAAIQFADARLNGENAAPEIEVPGPAVAASAPSNVPTQQQLAEKVALENVQDAVRKAGKDMKDTGVTGEQIVKLDANQDGKLEQDELKKLSEVLGKGVDVTPEQLAQANGGSIPLTKQQTVARVP